MNAPLSDSPLLFLDFEASSLREDSWPIEIGWSTICHNQVRTVSSLIRPRADWSVDGWCEISAEMHCIAREALDAAPDADRIAEETDRLAPYTVVSDAPAWDAFWLRRLREGRPVIQVMGLASVAADRLSTHAVDWLFEYLERRRSPHRAGPDSARLARAWLDAVRRTSG